MPGYKIKPVRTWTCRDTRPHLAKPSEVIQGNWVHRTQIRVKLSKRDIARGGFVRHNKVEEASGEQLHLTNMSLGFL